MVVLVYMFVIYCNVNFVCTSWHLSGSAVCMVLHTVLVGVSEHAEMVKDPRTIIIIIPVYALNFLSLLGALVLLTTPYYHHLAHPPTGTLF